MRPVVSAARRVSESHRMRIVGVWIGLLIFSLAAVARDHARPALPPADLVGHWRGEGRIASDWTSVQLLPVDIGILPDGAIAGRIGDAEIADGTYAVTTKHSSKSASFTLSVNLNGELLRDGVIRKAFELQLSSSNGRLVGSGTSDGGRVWPGSWRETRRHSARLEVRSVSLSRVAARSP